MKNLTVPLPEEFYEMLRQAAFDARSSLAGHVRRLLDEAVAQRHRWKAEAAQRAIDDEAKRLIAEHEEAQRALEYLRSDEGQREIADGMEDKKI